MFLVHDSLKNIDNDNQDLFREENAHLRIQHFMLLVQPLVQPLVKQLFKFLFRLKIIFFKFFFC